MDNKKVKIWECSVCGALLEDEVAPEYCLLCLNENVFFIKIDDKEK